MEAAGFEEVQVSRYVVPFCGESEATTEMREYGKCNCVAIPMMLHHAIPRAEEQKVEDMRQEMRECLRAGMGGGGGSGVLCYDWAEADGMIEGLYHALLMVVVVVEEGRRE